MKGLRILSDPDELLLLGNKNAYDILNLLRTGEYSGTGVAEVLGIKAQLATYYLNKLEKFGLAEMVRTEQKRRTLRKFFRATAKRFLVFFDVGENTDKMDIPLRTAYLENLQFVTMQDMINDSIDLIVNDCLKITKNDKVLLKYRQNVSKYLEKFVTKLRNIGAEYRFEYFSLDLVQEFWSELPINRIEQHQEYFSDQLKWPTVYILIGRDPKPDLADIPESRIKTISNILYNNEYSFNLNNKLRYAHFQIFPFGKGFLTDSKIVERLQMYWNAASLTSEDYTIVKSVADYILRNNSLIIQSSHHNELRVKVSKDKYFIMAGPSSSSHYEGRANFILPCGSLTVIPEDNSINGEIYCEATNIENIKGVRLRVVNNVVIEAKAYEGLEELKSRLNKFGIEGRTISILGFGLNTGIKNGELLPELMSDMNGAISIVFGSNEHLGGKIKNVAQWILTSMSPQMKAGDKLILSENKYSI